MFKQSCMHFLIFNFIQRFMQQLKSYSRIIVISGTLLIWIIKFFIRPFNLYADWLSPFIGFAPNLIGTFLLPFGAYWLFKKYFLVAE